jgi:hypothetical protein
VSFLLGGVVSSSILRGDSETECLLEEVVDDGLDDDDPFFLVKRLVVFFPGCSTLLTNINPGFSTGNKVHQYYFGVWTLSGIRMCFVGRNKRGGWLSLRWFRKLEHTNKESDERLTYALMLALLLRDRVLHGVAPSKCSRPLLCLHCCSFHLMFSL